MFGIFKKKQMAKWRIVPDDNGTYTLEMWHGDVGMYLAEVVRVTKEQAEESIKRLEGDILYFGSNS